MLIRTHVWDTDLGFTVTYDYYQVRLFTHDHEAGYPRTRLYNSDKTQLRAIRPYAFKH